MFKAILHTKELTFLIMNPDSIIIIHKNSIIIIISKKKHGGGSIRSSIRFALLFTLLINSFYSFGSVTRKIRNGPICSRASLFLQEVLSSFIDFPPFFKWLFFFFVVAWHNLKNKWISLGLCNTTKCLKRFRQASVLFCVFHSFSVRQS